MDFSQSNCRVCLSSDAPLYISVEDEAVNVKIVDLLQELSSKKLFIIDGLSHLICTSCCSALVKAVRLKRLFLRNDKALLDCYQFYKTKILLGDDDPFLREDAELEFVENPHEDANKEEEEEVSTDDPDTLVKAEIDRDEEDEVDWSMEIETLEVDSNDIKKELESADEDEPKTSTILEISKLDEHYRELESLEFKSELECSRKTLIKVVPKEVVLKLQSKPVTTSTSKSQKPVVDRTYVLMVPQDQLKFTCCMCYNISETEEQLIAHLHTHPERTRRSAFRKKFKEAAPDQRKNITGKECIKCLRRFRPSSLPLHLKQYYVEQKFQCSNCGVFFGFFSYMKQHERKCIKTAKVAAGLLAPEKFECHICGKSLKTKVILESHLNLHFRTEAERTQFKCKICNKGYPSLRGLRSHVLLHTDVAIFDCHMCGKAFKKKNNLEAHIRVHNNDRIFKCNYCPKTYIHSTDRKRHEMSVHTGVRPFKCELCNDGFIKRHSLNVHMKKAHSIDSNQMIVVYE